MTFWIIYLIISALLVAVILLQDKESDLGSMGGGSSEIGNKIVRTRRGAEAFLHQATIMLSILFVAGGLYGIFTNVSL